MKQLNLIKCCLYCKRKPPIVVSVVPSQSKRLNVGRLRSAGRVVGCDGALVPIGNHTTDGRWNYQAPFTNWIEFIIGITLVNMHQTK
jgi:hypothetical protein